MRILLFVLSFVFIALSAFAAEPGPIPHLDEVTSWLLNPSAWVAAALPVLVQWAAAKWPTKNPAGLLHWAAGLALVGAAGAVQLAKALTAMGQFVDKAIPQNLTPVKAEQQSSDQQKT